MQKIPFQPSINSRSLHWNDVVSFDDLLFRFLLDLRVLLTFTSMILMGAQIAIGLPMIPVEDIEQTS